VTKEFIDMMVKEIVKVEKVLREVNGPWRDGGCESNFLK
jgi:hypothetical protein